MKIRLAVIAGILVLAAACAPSTPTPPEITPQQQITRTEAPAGGEPSPTDFPPTETPLVEEITETVPAQEVTPLEPAATLTEWELVQRTVATYLNRLGRGSDGYQGLTLALEQPEPNQTWCGGLGAAIADFDYANDGESAQVLRDLQISQGCD